MITGVSHLLLQVGNYDTCRDLYLKLGLKEVGATRKANGMRAALLAVGKSALELHEDPTAGPYVDPSTDRPIRSMMNEITWVNHFSFHTHDARTTYERLEHSGIPWLCTPSDQPVGHHGTRRRLLEYDDPDLLTIQLAELIDNEGNSAEPTDVDLAAIGWPEQACDKIDHVALRVSNLHAKREFYRDCLGLRETVYRTTRLGQESTVVAGDTIFELLWTTTTRTPLVKGTVCGVAFATGDLDAAYRALRERGVAVSAPADESPVPGVHRRAISLVDPDGFPVQIVQTA